jgi:hypothetical protein
MASEKKKSSSRSRSVSGKRISAGPAPRKAARPARRFAICVKNENYPASLELRKLYAIIEDTFADQHDMIRIVDESGDDYLYPRAYFLRIDLPRAIELELEKTA